MSRSPVLRATLAILASLLLLPLSFPPPTNAQRRKPAPRQGRGAAGARPSSAIDREAAEINQRYWERFFVKCGDSYYGEREFGLFNQFKGVTFGISPAGLTGLDKENGYEWRGEGLFKYSRKRAYAPISREWADWERGGVITTIVMHKKRGRWQIAHRPFEEYIRLRTCEELSQFGVAASPPAAVAPADGGGGRITGTVSLVGVPPEPMPLSMSADQVCANANPDATSEEVVVTEGKLANVVVYVTGNSLKRNTFKPPPWPVEIELRQCRILPRVVGVQIGQTLRLLNSDQTAHATSTLSFSNPKLSLYMARGGDPIERRFERPELFIMIKDVLHPWERSFVGVFWHPFFSVSDKAGSYGITGLPPGEYTVVAWHEKYPGQQVKVSIGANDTKEINFTFTAEEQ